MTFRMLSCKPTALPHLQPSEKYLTLRGRIDSIPVFITKTRLFKYMYTENFNTKKVKKKNHIKILIFHICAQNIDCGTG